MKRKLFRMHCGGLSESLATATEVHSLSEMISHIIECYHAPDDYFKNIHIREECLKDTRCGEEWSDTYRVLADFDGHTNQCIGYCNFTTDSTQKELLEEAIELASCRHSRQEDKAGMPYILHPLRVMISLQREYALQSQDTEYWDMCIAAVLHDIVEDTQTSFIELMNRGFSNESICIVALLTRKKEEEYTDYIKRICESKNRAALIIKLADLKDNMDKPRLNHPLTEKDYKRLLRYNQAYVLILEALKNLN